MSAKWANNPWQFRGYKVVLSNIFLFKLLSFKNVDYQIKCECDDGYMTLWDLAL